MRLALGAAAVGAAVAVFTLRWRRRRKLLDAFEQDGYCIVRNLLSPAEVARLEEAVKCDGGIEEHAYGRDDGMGRRTRSVSSRIDT
jgi:hypothetical protein